MIEQPETPSGTHLPIIVQCKVPKDFLIETSDLPYTHNGLKFILKSNPFLHASILSEKNHELFNYCQWEWFFINISLKWGCMTIQRVLALCYFWDLPKNFQRIPKEFPKNFQIILMEFPQKSQTVTKQFWYNYQRISKEFPKKLPKNSQKFPQKYLQNT